MAAEYAFDVWDPLDPTGTFLVRLTVGDQLVDAEFHSVLYGTGDGSISIHADDPDCVHLQRRAWVQVVRIDTTPDRYLGGFFLEQGDFRALSKKEQAGRILTFTGRGGLSILERYVLGHSIYAPGQSHRGTFDVPGKWHWEGEPYGAMLTRLIEEGINHPHEPYLPITYGFTRTRDSDNLLWDELADYETPIGTDGLKLYADFMRLGLVAQMSADLELITSRSVEDFGTDRSSATFAAGKVRFQAGQNIANELPKRIAASRERTFVLIEDRIGDYQTVDEDIDGNPLTGVESGKFLKSTTTADDAAIVKMGQLHLTSLRKQGDQCQVEHIIGPGGASGADGYDPGPAGNYDVGDLVTVHTGTAEHDYNEQTIEVAGYRIFLRDGNWMAEVELGAQYLEPSVEAVGDRISSVIRDGTPITFCQATETVASEYELVGVSVTEHPTGDGPSTLPSAWAPGMVAIAHCRFDGSGGPHIPTPPSGWTGIGAGGSAGGPVSGIGQRGAWRELQAGDTDAGTWVHGTSVIVAVFRGPPPADPIGSIAGSTTPSGQLSISAVTLEVVDGSSRVIAFGVHKSDAIGGDALTGTQPMSSIATASLGDHGAWISDAGVTAWGAHTIACTNDDRLGTAYELLGGGATLVQGDGRVELVGTGTSVKRCDDTEHWHEAGSGAPTVTDDEDAGFRLHTLWINDDGEAWYLTDASAGAAVWVQLVGTGGGGGGGGLTIETELRHSTTQSIATATDTAVTWDTEMSDAGAMHAGGSPTRITVGAAQAGKVIRLNAQISTTSAAATQWQVWIRKNGTTELGKRVRHMSSTAAITTVQIDQVVGGLVATDYLEVMVRQASGSSRDIGSATADANNFLQVISG